jgi:hypothetical protein
MTSKFAARREAWTKPLTAGSSSTTSIFCTVGFDVVASGISGIHFDIREAL